MALYVYGITRSSAIVDGAGIGDAPLMAIAADGVAAVASALDDDAWRLGPGDLRVHNRVLERLSAHETVLPMRVGATMRDADDVRSRLLGPFGAELAAQIDAFEGRVEVELRAVYDERRLLEEIVGEHPAIARERAMQHGLPAAATHYRRIELGRLIAEAVEQTRARDAGAVIETLSTVADQVKLRPPAHERMAFNAALLVARERLAELARVLDEVADAQDGRMRFKYTGPLPPYSFVALEEAA